MRNFTLCFKYKTFLVKIFLQFSINYFCELLLRVWRGELVAGGWRWCRVVSLAGCCRLGRTSGKKRRVWRHFVSIQDSLSSSSSPHLPSLSLSLSLVAGGTRHHATEISEEKCVGVTSYRLLPPDQWEASFFAGCWGGGRARPPIRTFFLVPRRVGRGAGDTAAVLGQSTLHIAFKCWGFKYLIVWPKHVLSLSNQSKDYQRTINLTD